jgi:hypothetical protein
VLVLAAAVLTIATAASRGQDRSGGMHELGIYSPGVIYVRKEEIEREDLIGDGFGRKSGRRLEEEGGPDVWARDVSDGMRTPVRARELGLRRFTGLGPSGKQGRGAGCARGRRRGALSGCCWARPNPRREMKILFFFFSNFPKHFPNKF